jgi:hypothetical protein
MLRHSGRARPLTTYESFIKLAPQSAVACAAIPQSQTAYAGAGNPCQRAQVLMDADSSLDHVFFPDSGVVSVVAVYADGSIARQIRPSPSTESPMELILIIVVLLLLFGGGGGYFGRRRVIGD